MTTWLQPLSLSHSASSSRPAAVAAKVRTSRAALPPATRRTVATAVASWTSRPAQRDRGPPWLPPLGAPPVREPRRGSLADVLRVGGPALAQAGVLEGSRVQLENGLARTKAKADLGAGGAPPS